MTGVSRLSILRRIRAVGAAAKSRSVAPPGVIGTVLDVWRREDFGDLPRSSLPRSPDLAKDARVVQLVDVLRSLSLLDAAYWLSSMYAMLSEESYRKRMAMFFTPASLTNGLLDDLDEQGVDFGSQTFLDPACGGAAFLAPIALRMRSALRARGRKPVQVLRHIEEHLYGTDLDPALCELSVQFLRMALYEEVSATGYVPAFRVHQADSLSALAGMFGTIDVVVCNPPYRKMGSDELPPYRAAYADVIEAQPNLYCLFIGLCVRLLKVNGHCALVTPTSFLSGQYFSRLRTFLINNTEIAHIGMVADRLGVFIDVEQETALTVLRRRVEEQQSQAIARVSVVSADGEYTNVGDCRLPNSGSVWPIPRTVADVRLLKAATKSKYRLADYGYRARIGAYVWNRDTRPKFESIREVRKAKSKTAIPLIWSRDILPEGFVHFDGAEASEGEHRFVDLGDERHPSVVRVPSVVLQRVTSNDQPRRLVAASVPLHIFISYGGFVGENHVVVLEPTTPSPALDPAAMAKLLSAKSIDRLFRCISGATNVSVFELGQLALPNPKTLLFELEKGSSIEEAVDRSYGLVFGG